MIIVVEPQCWGLEHGSFNAALLSTISLSCNDKILFYAEESHINAVCKIIQKYDPKLLSNLECFSIIIPKRTETGWLRLFKEWTFLVTMLGLVGDKRCKNLIFTSITNTGIFALKLLLKKKYNFQVIVGLHGMLARISGRLPIKPWNWIFSIKFIFYLKQPLQLKYLVFGESIYNNVEKINPRIINFFRHIDLPNYEYEFNGGDLTRHHGKIIFGYIGTGNLTKGIGVFANIAKAVSKISNSVEFLLVGFLSAWRDNTDYSAIKGISEIPLTTDEYISRGQSLTYAINTSNPEFYKFGGCSSFIDALFLGKPGIYLRNDYIEYYFEKIGNIGYLCDSYEEVLDITTKVALQFPEEIYNQQIDNIKRGREQLLPKAVAVNLKKILV